MGRSAVISLLMGLVWLLAACDELAEHCTGDPDCPEGMRCVRTQCAVAPETDLGPPPKDARPDRPPEPDLGPEEEPDVALDAALDAAADEGADAEPDLSVDLGVDAADAELDVAPDADLDGPPPDLPEDAALLPDLAPDLALDVAVDVPIDAAVVVDVALPIDVEVVPDVALDRPDVDEPDLVLPPLERSCPPDLDWERNGVLWLSTDRKLIGLDLTPIYRGGQLDVERDVVRAMPALGEEGALRPLRLLPDGYGAATTLTAGQDQGAVFVGDLSIGLWSDREERPGVQGASIAALGDTLEMLAPSTDGASLAVGLQRRRGNEALIAVIDTETGLQRDLDPERPGVDGLPVEELIDMVQLRDGRLIYSAAGRVHALRDHAPALPIFESRLGPPATFLASDDETLAVAIGGAVALVDLDAPEAPAQIIGEAQAGSVRKMALFEDELYLVRRRDGLLYLERHAPEAEGFSRAFVESPGAPSRHRLLLSRDGAFVFHLVEGEGALRIFDAETGELVQSLEIPVGDMALRAARDSPERCNAEDDDCDGRVDEDFALGVDCESPGACGRGRIECGGPLLRLCNTAPGGSMSRSGPERCNQVDDDCDGRVDEDPPVLAADPVVLEAGPSIKGEPDLIWTGEGYAVAWTDDRAGETDIALLLFDAEGQPLIPTTRPAAHPGPQVRPRLAWSGQVLGLSWTTLAQVGPVAEFSLVGANGHPPFNIPTRIAEGGLVAQMLWTRNRFSVSWFHFVEPMLAVTHLGALGAIIGEERVEVEPVRNAAAAWTGTDIALAWWTAGREGAMALERLPQRGGERGRTLIAGGGDLRAGPGLAFAPPANQFGAFYWRAGPPWPELRMSTIRCDALVNDALVARGEGELRVDATAFGRSEYVAMWREDRDGQPGLWLARTDLAGRPAGSPIRATPEATDPRSPSIVWNGEEYGLVYVDRGPEQDALVFVHGPFGCSVE